MSQQGILFTMPIVAVIDNLGVIATGGSIKFFEAANHATPKNVYQDAALTITWGPVITLNSIGEQPSNNLIYLSSDAPYFVQFLDQYGTVLKEFDNYPYPSSGGSLIPDQNIENFVQNPSFAYTLPLPTVMPAVETPIAPGNWAFKRSNLSSTMQLSFEPFAAGQESVPGNPLRYLHYACTAPGSGETYLYVIVQEFDNVETFANESVVFDCFMRSATSSNVEFQVIQNFGDGGSPAVTTPIETYSLTGSWTENSSIFVMPDISDKTIGLGSNVQFVLAYPLNASATIDLGVTAIYESTKLIAYQEVPSNFVATQCLESQYPLVCTANLPEFNTADGNFMPILKQNSSKVSFQSWAGTLVELAFAYQAGLPYLKCDGSAIYSQQYYNLANAISTNWGIGANGFYSDSTNGVTFTEGGLGAYIEQPHDVNTGMKVYVVTNGVSSAGVTQVLCLPGSMIPNSSCFINSGTVAKYCVWFNLNGTGVNPAMPGYGSMEVNYTGTETAAQMAALIAQLSFGDIVSSIPTNALKVTAVSNGNVTAVAAGTSGFTVNQVTSGSSTVQAVATVQVASIPAAGTYFLINSPATNYYVWFSQDNLTPDPGSITALAGKVGIKVIFTASDTIATFLANLAQQLINAQVLLPTLDGMFTRVRANGSSNDPDRNSRTAIAQGANSGDNIGSFQDDQLLRHSHDAVAYSVAGGAGNRFGTASGGASFPVPGVPTDPDGIRESGGNQSNPKNLYTEKVILF